jgi:hypothetical protein
MAETSPTNSQTLVIESSDFSFETISDENGYATVVKFKLENPQVSAGDVLLVLAGSEICFHGLIGQIEDGYATASDPRGSQLPARTH